MTLSEQQTTQMTAADLDVITIVINDQSHQVASKSNLQQIISQFALPEMGCVFAINNNVVPRRKDEIRISFLVCNLRFTLTRKKKFLKKSLYLA